MGRPFRAAHQEFPARTRRPPGTPCSCSYAWPLTT